MQSRIFPASLFLSCLAFLFISQAASAKKMYRWVDEHGKTFLSDQIPPEQVQYRRESLSEKGRVLEITEQAKTREQQALDDRLKALKQAQEKIIAKQRSHDKVLLSTYRKLDDMQSALKTKMQALDAQGNILRSNLKQTESQLENQLKIAAGRERNGEKIPQALQDSINANKAQSQAALKEIDKHAAKKNQAKAEFEADMERYKFLTQSTTEELQNLSDKTAGIIAADALGLYLCANETVCAKAWDIAGSFVKAHSTTATDIANDKLIMTAAPATDTDLSLSVSKLELENKKQQLFLDIRCRASSLGAELCDSQKVRDIRSAFRSYIESALAGVPTN